MKNIILIITILAAFSCKKKESTPVVQNDQPVCKTYNPDKAGKYVIEGRHDTIIVIFTQNNCPTNSHNIYIVKKLGEAVQFNLSNGNYFDIKDYMIDLDETNGQGHSGQFEFNFYSNNVISIVSTKLNHSLNLIKL